MELLEVNHLCKTYGSGETAVKALKNVSFSVPKGEYVAIVGESGSGKSTLLNMIGALDTPTSGKVLIDGKDIFSMNDRKLTVFRRRNIGFIFQAFNLIPELTVEQNIIFPVLLDYQKPDKKYLEELLTVLNLKERRNHLPSQLSGGQQQRVAIGRALITRPSLILADEPTGNLDTQNSSERNTFSRPLEPWDKVMAARQMKRLASVDYMGQIFDEFMELHGDRYFRDDPAIVGGIAYLDGQPVTVIGVHKGKDLKDCKERNFGMPSPEGYRKAIRLMKQAEKFNRPIITFVNTSGAYPGKEAEENGQGEAIARNLYEMSGIQVPILCLMIGEGGSGGALALAVGNEVWMMENATYSILSPEGFASILWKDGKRAKEAATVMKITAQDLKELSVVDKVIPEYGGADDDALTSIAAWMKGNMKEFLFHDFFALYFPNPRKSHKSHR